jgi:hypothetical protein
MNDDYNINEADIEVVLRFIKYHEPWVAPTRENAIKKLEELQGGFHSMSHNNPERLKKLQKQLDERRAKRKKQLGDQ